MTPIEILGSSPPHRSDSLFVIVSVAAHEFGFVEILLLLPSSDLLSTSLLLSCQSSRQLYRPVCLFYARLSCYFGFSELPASHATDMTRRQGSSPTSPCSGSIFPFMPEQRIELERVIRHIFTNDTDIPRAATK